MSIKNFELLNKVIDNLIIILYVTVIYGFWYYTVRLS